MRAGFRAGLGGGARIATLALVLLAAGAAQAAAATIKVNTKGDEYDLIANSTCSLREAVTSANSDTAFGGCTTGNGPDTIQLRARTTYIREQSSANADDDNLTGDYDISSPITIAVKGRGRATISGGGFDRVIQVTPTGRLTASKLKIVSGSVAPFQPTSISGGGGIMSFGTLHLSHSVVDANETLGSSSNNGGGIATSGPATLDHVVVSGNTAENVGGGVWWWGGHMVIDHSTISGNVSTSSGGGLLIGADAGTNSFLIKNSTVSGNTELADGGNEGGGGINVGDYTNARMRAVNVTISGNKAYGSGGGVYEYAGQFSLKYATVVRNKAVLGGQPFDHGGGMAGGTIATNSIVAANRDLNPTDPADDCYGSVSVSSSLVGRNTGCAAPPTNLQPAKPHIGRLRDNGGPTETVAISRKSAAVNHGTKPAPGRDQRGKKRDAHPDIGAYELVPKRHHH